MKAVWGVGILVTGQKPPDDKPPRIIEEISAKYAVEANLFRLGSTNPKKKSSPWFFFCSFMEAYCWGAFVQRLFVGGLLT